MLGDSIDAMQLAEVCMAAGLSWPEWTGVSHGDPSKCRYPDDKGGYSDKTVCITCQLPALTLAKDALWSMSRVGPFWKKCKRGLAHTHP
eukprot:jgi/Botrbrau1/6362/Bobra.0098s0021.1